MSLYELLTLLLGASHLLNDGQGRVEVQSAQDVADIEGIHCAISLKVIDREGEVRP